MFKEYGYVFLIKLEFSKSYTSWLDDLSKLNLLGFELYESPIKYGNFGFLKFLKTPSDAGVVSKVAK